MTAPTRRTVLALAAALAGAAAMPLAARAEEAPTMRVAKSPSCGCCGAWVRHLRAEGFRVETVEMGDDALERLKADLGLAPGLRSCHTGVVEGYVVEGHVPAGDIRRLLATRPPALGLAVPGMPVGSPGMEIGDRRDPYDTLLVGPGGGVEVFASHR